MANLATLHVTFTTADPSIWGALAERAGIVPCMTVDMVCGHTVQFSVENDLAASAVAILEADPLVIRVDVESLSQTDLVNKYDWIPEY